MSKNTYEVPYLGLFFIIINSFLVWQSLVNYIFKIPCPFRLGECGKFIYENTRTYSAQSFHISKKYLKNKPRDMGSRMRMKTNYGRRNPHFVYTTRNLT